MKLSNNQTMAYILGTSAEKIRTASIASANRVILHMMSPTIKLEDAKQEINELLAHQGIPFEIDEAGSEYVSWVRNEIQMNQEELPEDLATARYSQLMDEAVYELLIRYA